MEINERYKLLLADYTSALRSLEKAIAEDIAMYTPLIQDLIRNGRVQKFEVCTELAWKTAKLFIEIELGEIIGSPKQVYRKLFTVNLADMGLFEGLLATIDDRNQLSHIYKEDHFEKVENRLGVHLLCFKNLLNRLT